MARCRINDNYKPVYAVVQSIDGDIEERRGYLVDVESNMEDIIDIIECYICSMEAEGRDNTIVNRTIDREHDIYDVSVQSTYNGIVHNELIHVERFYISCDPCAIHTGGK